MLLCLDQILLMTTLTYNLSRQQAANRLGISTRTIDRYVKWGKLSYKKVANKVILAQEEINTLQDEFALLHQQENNNTERERAIPIQKVQKSLAKKENNIDIAEFANILAQKDKAIEEKNQLIFWLQHKLWELETKMNQMIALPDHTQEKEKLQDTIKELEIKKLWLMEEVRKEKLWNAVYIGLVLIAAVMILFFTFMA